MEYVTTKKMIDYCKFVRVQGHARQNAYSAIESELYKQKYGEYPEVVDIWDMDKDIKEEAEKMGSKIFNQLSEEGIFYTVK